MADTYNVDFSFIEKQEGEIQTIGYVPVCTKKSTENPQNKACYLKPIGSVIGNSGVTVAAGFDLGQQDLNGLKNMGLTPEIISKLEPYLGYNPKNKKDPVQKLNEIPLVLTTEEASLVNQKVKASYISRLRKAYKAKSAVDYFDLPQQAQTVILSFYFQNGWDNTNSYHKEFYDAVTTQNWPAAVAILRKAAIYKSRRLAEADLLQKVVA